VSVSVYVLTGKHCSLVVTGEIQELLELAQRKFLRQVVQYADAMEASPFPRLFVLDFLSDEEKASLKAADEPMSSKPSDELSHQCPLTAAEAADAATHAEVIWTVQLLVVNNNNNNNNNIITTIRMVLSRAHTSFEVDVAANCYCWTNAW